MMTTIYICTLFYHNGAYSSMSHKSAQNAKMSAMSVLRRHVGGTINKKEMTCFTSIVIEP